MFLFQIRITQKLQGWFFSTKSQEKALQFCLTFWFESSSFWSVHRNSDSLNVPKVPMKLNFLDIQLHVSPQLRTWFVPTLFWLTVFRLWQSNNMNDVDFLLCIRRLRNQKFQEKLLNRSTPWLKLVFSVTACFISSQKLSSSNFSPVGEICIAKSRLFFRAQEPW